MQRDEASIPSSMNLGGVEGGWVRYWDEASTVAMLEFNVVEPVAQQAHVAASKEKKKKPKGESQSSISQTTKLTTVFTSCRTRTRAIGTRRTFRPSSLRQTGHAEL